MGPRSFFLAASLFFGASIGHAAGVQDIEQLRQDVLAYTQAHYEAVYGKERFAKNVQISVGRLDPRLRLAKCDNHLTFKIHEPQIIRNITVKTSCESSYRWTVYVPASIDIYSDVLVVTRSLQKGDILSADDLEFKRLNTSTARQGHIEDLARAKGLELKRPLKSGDMLRLSYLKKPNIVHKGQKVIVSSKSRFLSVESAAIALVNGYMGQRIRVKNERSNQVIEAEVIAPGKVIVATR